MLAGSVLLPGAAVAKTATAAQSGSQPAVPASAVNVTNAATPAVAPALPAVVGNAGTRSIDFDSGWKFVLVNPAGVSDPSGVYGTSVNPPASAPGFDDSSWRSVTLPHDWSIELLPQATGVSNATGFFQGSLPGRVGRAHDSLASERLPHRASRRGRAPCPRGPWTTRRRSRPTVVLLEIRATMRPCTQKRRVRAAVTSFAAPSAASPGPGDPRALDAPSPPS